MKKTDQIPDSSDSPDAAEAEQLRLQKNAQYGSAVAATVLMRMETQGYAAIPADSIYGAALAMPQIARSAGWLHTYTGLVARIYLFLFITVAAQIFLIIMVKEETKILNTYSGQMHLCDFGKDLQNCPDGPNCRGPGGTHFSYPRLYSFDSWILRIFVRDTLKALLPQKAEEIEQVADPGEWGLENYYCRLVCVFLFMTASVDDFKRLAAMLNMLVSTPNRPEFWVEYEVPSWGEKKYVEAVRNWQELDFVKFKVAGMTLKWKLFSFSVIILPKALVWLNLCSAGVDFLMETSGILDLIVNSVALSFILQLDSVMFDQLVTEATKYIMSSLENVQLFDTMDVEQADEVPKIVADELGPFTKHPKALHLLFPKRFIVIVLLSGIFLYYYYWTNCELLADGSYVSKPMTAYPDNMQVPYWQVFLGLARGEEDEYWSMPDDS